MGKGSPVVTGKSAANQSLFCDGHTAAGAGSWRPRAVGLVQGVQTKTVTGKSQLLQEERLWRQEPGCLTLPETLPEFLRNVKGPGQKD